MREPVVNLYKRESVPEISNPNTASTMSQSAFIAIFIKSMNQLKVLVDKRW